MGLGFKVYGSGRDLEFRAQGSGFRFYTLELMVCRSGSRVWGLGIGV